MNDLPFKSAVKYYSYIILKMVDVVQMYTEKEIKRNLLNTYSFN